MFFVFAVFHFLCKFLILNETCRNDKIVNFSLTLDLGTDEHKLRVPMSGQVAQLDPGSCRGGSPPFKIRAQALGGL